MRKLFLASSILLFWSLFLSCTSTPDTPSENPDSDKKPSANTSDSTGANDSLFYIIDEAFEKPIGQTTVSFLKTNTSKSILYSNNSLYPFEKGRNARLCWIAKDPENKKRKYAIIIFDSDGNRLFKHLSSFTADDGIQYIEFTPPYSFDGLVSFWQLKKDGGTRYRSMGTEINEGSEVCPEKNAKSGFLNYLLPPPATGRKTISSTQSDGGTVVVTIDDR
jgi:hypothetical protein